MPAPSPEQLDALLKSGSISQQTYDSAMGAQPAVSQDPTAGMPNSSPLTPSTPIPPATNVPTPMTDNEALLARQEAIGQKQEAPPTPPAEVLKGTNLGYTKMSPAEEKAAEQSLKPSLQLTTPAAPPGQGDSGATVSNSDWSKVLAAPPRAGYAESKADKEHLTNLNQQGLTVQDTVNANIAAQRDVAQGFKATTDTLSQQATLANQQYQKQLEAEKAERAALSQRNIESREKIDAELIKAQNEKLNPNRYWQEMNTGSKILAGIGLALGGLGGAGTGGKNYAADVVNGAITRDLEAQKSDLANKVEVLGKRSSNVYKNMDTDMAVLNAQHDATYKGYQSTIDLVEKKAGMRKDDAQMQQQAATLIGSLTEKRDASLANIEAQQYQVKKQAELRRQAAAESQYARTIQQQQELKSEAAKFIHDPNFQPPPGMDRYEAAMREASRIVSGVDVHPGAASPSVTHPGSGASESTVNLPDGSTGHALTKEAADDYRQRSLGADKFQRAVAEMQKIREGFAGGVFSPSDRARYEGLAAEAKTAYVQMNGFKRTPNETEFHALDKIIPPTINNGILSPVGAVVGHLSTDAVLKQASQLADDARKDASGQYLKK